MQPEPLELTPEQLERAVDALEALMRPKLRALVQRRYGMVGVEGLIDNPVRLRYNMA
jgi:hypothetical protein